MNYSVCQLDPENAIQKRKRKDWIITKYTTPSTSVKHIANHDYYFRTQLELGKTKHNTHKII